jgi:hypothetical protein
MNSDGDWTMLRNGAAGSLMAAWLAWRGNAVVLLTVIQWMNQ